VSGLTPLNDTGLCALDIAAGWHWNCATIVVTFWIKFVASFSGNGPRQESTTVGSSLAQPLPDLIPRKMMTRAILAGAILALTLAACGKKEEAAPPAPPAPAAEPAPAPAPAEGAASAPEAAAPAAEGEKKE
jgi:hypothetical protein